MRRNRSTHCLGCGEAHREAPSGTVHASCKTVAWTMGCITAQHWENALHLRGILLSKKKNGGETHLMARGRAYHIGHICKILQHGRCTGTCSCRRQATQSRDLHHKLQLHWVKDKQG